MVPASGDVQVTLTVSQSNKSAALELLRQNLPLFTRLQIFDPVSPPYPGLSIFISYRRSDSEDVCGRIYDRLAAVFGKDSVFRDVERMPDAQDFREVIKREVAACNLLLAVMGQSWDSSRHLRSLNNSRKEDYVRLEIQTALQLQKPVIPIWVQRREQMPDETRLPEPLRPLVYRTARQARPDPDFHKDMDVVIQRIKDVLGLEDKGM
jgi:hypothetical protein